MCGRYGGPKDLQVYAGHLPVQRPFAATGLEQEYSKFQNAPVFARNSKGEIVVQSMRFGLIPYWHTGPIKSWESSTWNAQMETVATKPSFKRAWSRGRRCLVPASYVVETLRVVDVPGGKLNADFLFRDGRAMGLAGLWDYALTADGPVLSFALLTRHPGERMRELHPREVCVLPEQVWGAFLNGESMDWSNPWADDAWGVRLPERSKEKVLGMEGDLFSSAS